MHDADASQNFAQFLPKITQDLDDVTTQAANLPPKSELVFRRTLDKDLAMKLDKVSKEILVMTNSLLELVDPKYQSKQQGFADIAEDLTDRYKRNVVPSVDGLLEQTDTLLDEITGDRKKAAIQVKPEVEALAKQKLPGPFASNNGMPTWESSISMRRPQLDFPDPINNSVDRPAFTPTLPFKHHAMVPLDFVPPADYVLPEDPRLAASRLRRELEMRRHPYFHETRHIPYPTSLFIAAPVIKATPIESTKAVWVDTPEQLAEMVEELKKADEIGVDLEHHNDYSFHGFTCLMQISTREKDWLIDTLALRGPLREHKLGGVMANPAILKVFHGAESDIVWLQKDFDIYVVGLFDTFHACILLGIRPASLANLLALYCNFRADKQYQMADWRVRPLTKEMRFYAQADTHFILSIYDVLRNKLLEMSRAPSPDPEHAGSPAPSAATNPQRAMRQVLTSSAETALRVWSPETYNMEGSGSGGWKADLKRAYRGTIEPESRIGVRYKHIHRWRDRVAREEDEAVYTVLSRLAMTSLARFPPPTAERLSQVIGRRYQTALRRSEELLQVLSEADKEHKASGGAEAMSLKLPVPEGSPDAVSVESAQTLPIKSSEVVGQARDIPATVLFRHTASEAVPAPTRTTTSKLFGSAIPSKSGATATPAVKRKAESALFGPTKKTKAEAAPMGEVKPPSAFDDIMSAIAADMATKLPAILDSQAAAQDRLPEPETVPFVPAAQRSKTSNGAVRPSKVTEDRIATANALQDAEAAIAASAAVANKSAAGARSIVEPEVVAVKKRGRPPKVRPEVVDAASTADGPAAAIEQSDGGGKKRKKKTAAAKEIPEFDYSSVPNLLDNPKAAAAESSKRSGKDKEKVKKAKKDKPPAISGTTFGSVPQDMSQPKGGNRSQTFK